MSSTSVVSELQTWTQPTAHSQTGPISEHLPSQRGNGNHTATQAEDIITQQLAPADGGFAGKQLLQVISYLFGQIWEFLELPKGKIFLNQTMLNLRTRSLAPPRSSVYFRGCPLGLPRFFWSLPELLFQVRTSQSKSHPILISARKSNTDTEILTTACHNLQGIQK